MSAHFARRHCFNVFISMLPQWPSIQGMSAFKEFPEVKASSNAASIPE
jgi:hypothetical protein